MRTDLPRDKAFSAWTLALRFQVAFRIFRLDLEVRFFGTAMTRLNSNLTRQTLIVSHSATILHRLHPTPNPQPPTPQLNPNTELIDNYYD